MTYATQNAKQYKKVVVERVYNQTIYIFRLPDSTKRAIDEFYDVVDGTRRSWPIEQPFFALFDVSTSNIILNAYSRQRMIELSRHMPEGFHGAYTLVLPDTLAGALINVFLRVLPNRRPAFRFQTFTDYDEALTWLQTQVDTYPE